MLALEVIDDVSRLAEIQNEWSSFIGTMKGATPFQLPQWLLTWWSHFGSGRLRVLVFSNDGAIAAIIPFFRHEWNGRRQMTLIGSGVSDYLEPAISPEHLPEVLDGLRAHLEADSEWDICDWQDLSGDTPLKRLEFKRGIAASFRDDTPCSEIRLAGSFEEFWRKRPKQLRQNCRRDKARAEMAGSLEFATGKRNHTELLEELIDLHAARWQRRGETGVIAANGSAEFLRDIVAEFSRRHILQFFSLTFQDRIAAIILTFVYSNTSFFYLSGFDPAHETFGFGRMLLHHALRHCFDAKYDSWNFLRGEEPYKFSWGAQRIPKCRIIVTRAS
ncbi:MAG: GNAT family N-acetyltransferase [Bryobacteraceae bacterium]